jgi:carbohydrate-selective porin OprB
MSRRLLFLLPLAWALTAVAQPQDDTLRAWWRDHLATRNLFGFRDARGEHGLTLGGRWRGIYLGVLSSEGGSGSFFSQELAFAGRLDLAKLTRLEGLEGLSAFGGARYRQPGYYADPNNAVDGLGLFNPSRFTGGTGWRLAEFGLKYTTPELFGCEELLSLKAGWVRPRQEFMDQDLTGFFVNNAVASSDGVAANIPFSTSFSTWGGTVEMRPTEWNSTKVGLFMSYPQGTDSNNNGLMFRGYTPDLSQNGLWFMAQTGANALFGPGELPGNYVIGAYLYQNGAGGSAGNQTGLYLLNDQLVFREQAARGDAREQGLKIGTLFTFAPSYNNEFPVYGELNAVYTGALPRRDRDSIIFGVAYAPWQQSPGASYALATEAGYRFRLNGWAWLQPYAQYIVQPAGTPAVANAAVIGLFVGVDF